MLGQGTAKPKVGGGWGQGAVYPPRGKPQPIGDGSQEVSDPASHPSNIRQFWRHPLSFSELQGLITFLLPRAVTLIMQLPLSRVPCPTCQVLLSCSVFGETLSKDVGIEVVVQRVGL